MDKIQSREIPAFCPSFDRAAPKSVEPLEFPIMLRDSWATSQGVDEILAMRVFSGDVDELEMPPEESNWDGSWQLGGMGSRGQNCVCRPGEDKAGGVEGAGGEWQAVFTYVKCCQVEGRLPWCCAAPEGKLRAVNPHYRERGSAAKKEAFITIRDPQEQIACLVTQEVFVQMNISQERWWNNFRTFLSLVWLIKGDFLERER